MRKALEQSNDPASVETLNKLVWVMANQIVAQRYEARFVLGELVRFNPKEPVVYLMAIANDAELLRTLKFMDLNNIDVIEVAEEADGGLAKFASHVDTQKLRQQYEAAYARLGLPELAADEREAFENVRKSFYDALEFADTGDNTGL